MRLHRLIWLITAVAAVAALGVVASRNWTKSQRAAEEAASRVQRMFALLDHDAPAHAPETQAAVNAVAALVDGGTLDSAEGYYAVALRDRGLQRLDSAETAARKAVALRPEWSWPYYVLGVILHDMQREAEAEAAFKRAIQLDPAWSRPHNSLAVLLRMERRYDEALDAAQRALELAPDDVAAHNNFGNLLVKLGRFDEARLEYAEAIRLDPNRAAPYYNLACLSSLEGDTATALGHLARALELAPAFAREARQDPDLVPVRALPAFDRLMERFQRDAADPAPGTADQAG